MSAKRDGFPKGRRRAARHGRAKKKTQPNRKAPRRRMTARAKSKPVRRSATPRADRRLEFIDAAARVLDLAIEPAWKPAVAANLEATLRLAASFMEFPLPDEAEPAPIFVA
jgi:1-carboxybiuret hydrolase subunit AtzG-like protein